MKVLLVEDEDFIRDLFKRQLDLSGFSTDAFGTGQDGLAAITKNAYDLVLLDIMLPDINGLQILQSIRQNPVTKNIVVVLLTNLGQDAVIKQIFRKTFTSEPACSRNIQVRIKNPMVGYD